MYLRIVATLLVVLSSLISFRLWRREGARMPAATSASGATPTPIWPRESLPSDALSRQMMPTVRLKGLGVDGLIAEYAKTAGLKIRIGSRVPAVFAQDEELEIALAAGSAGDQLTVLLDRLGTTTTFGIDGGTIVIDRYIKFDDPRTRSRHVVFDVRDLLARPFVATTNNEAQGRFGQFSSSLRGAALMNLCVPLSWNWGNTSDGPREAAPGHYYEWDGFLYVNDTPENLRRIADRLDQLRHQKSLQSP